MYIPEGKENCTTTLGSTLAILQNVKMLTWPSNYIPVHVAKRNEKYVHKTLCRDSQRGLFPRSQNLVEVTLLCIHQEKGWTDCCVFTQWDMTHQEKGMTLLHETIV